MTFQPATDKLFRQLERDLDRSLGLSPAPKKSSPRNYPPHSETPSPSTPPPLPIFPGRLFFDIASQPLTWLWPDRIPLGHLTLLDAAPDCDPSLLALTLAASLSSGLPLPDGTPTSPSCVILYAPYDSASDTLKPRLEALGATPLKIMLFRPTRPTKSTSSTPTGNPINPTHTFSLSDDLEQLSTTIRFMKARLLILDPASAIIGLARHLPALVELAQQTNCAILLIRTLRHPVPNPLHASAPSSPILEAARSRLLLAPDPANQNHSLLLTTRHRLCSQATVPILSFAIHHSLDGLPILHPLGERNRADLARLCTGPVRSVHRQAILHFLQHSSTPQDTSTILAATSYDQDAGRQMLIRMRMAGELISPARGLYTTIGHPCLSQPPYGTPVTNDTSASSSPITSTSEPSSSSVANVTSTSSSIPDPPSSSLSNDNSDTSNPDVVNVTTIPSFPDSHIPTNLIDPTDPINPIESTTPATIVTNVTSVTHVPTIPPLHDPIASNEPPSYSHTQ